jgi:RNA polymerase sigma factor (sigma-70 family)
MDETEWLAERFEQHRPRLRAVAYRMLGSLTEADDAVQDAWIRLSRSNAEQIDNLGGWLTTVVARECLHMLRSRRRRREVSFEGHLPDPVITPDGDLDPEHQALLADGLGLALLVVLETLSPAERLAFVLHDTFGVPFEEIAPIVGRSPAASRQLASRARRKVRGSLRSQTPILLVRGRWWTRSLPPRETATSGRCSRCWTPTSCSGQTPVPRARRGRSAARERWPSRREPSRTLAGSRVVRW